MSASFLAPSPSSDPWRDWWRDNMKYSCYYIIDTQTGERTQRKWDEYEDTELIQLRILNSWNRIAQLGGETPRWLYYM